jgi:hypothetical protein
MDLENNQVLITITSEKDMHIAGPAVLEYYSVWNTMMMLAKQEERKRIISLISNQEDTFMHIADLAVLIASIDKTEEPDGDDQVQEV